ncbi:MAG: TonB-dependent receptor [Acidobacteria bacterium]|nr:TonB-dependent receptor [Acidobacteriota bacterium]
MTDPTGAAVAAAKVTVTHEATGVQTVVSTSAAGVYTAPQLPAAVYQVEVETSGFKKAIWSDVRVGVLQTLTLDFRLELGSVQDSVTVTGEVPLLTPTSAAISTSVAPREYQDLPIFFGGGFRSALGLVALLPGVNSAKGGTHISGGQANSRDFQLDGVSVTTAEVQGDGRGFQVPVDTIQEFSIITNSFSAEFGRTGGGVESYTLKSGTNQLHGMAYEYIRNDAFDARGFYAPSVPIAKQHDLGGNIGGPVIIPKIYNGKNKTFFFFNLSAYRFATAGGNFLATVPSLKFRDGNFTEQVDTRGAPIPIYDPATTRRDASGNLTRDVFAGSIIPKARFSKVAQAVQAYFPAPTRDGYFNNFNTFDKGKNQQDNYTGKIDHNIGANHKITASIAATIWPQTPTAVLPNPLSGKRVTFLDSWVSRATHDWVVTPTMVNHLALGFNRYIVQTAGETNGFDWYSKLGLTGDKVWALWGFPSFSVSGIGGFGGGGGFSTFDNTYSVVDSFSWQKGKHNIKMGIEIRRLQNNSVNPGNGPGAVVSNGATAFPSSALQGSTGIGWASFLLGEVYQANFFVNDITNGPRWGQYMTYFQDNWRLTPRLTLNLGLRWEIPQPFYDVNLAMSTIDMTRPNPAAGNLPGTLIFGKDWYKETGQKSFMDTSWREFGPRLGLAYRLPKDTVLRVAYGIYYNAGFGLGNGFRGSTAGYSGNITEAAPNVWETRWNLDQPYKLNSPMPPFLDSSFGVDTSNSLSAITRDLGKSAYIQSWNFGFQKQLKGNILMEADYVGSKGTRLPSLRFQGKQLPPWYWNLGPLLTLNIRDPQVAAAGFRPPYPAFRSTILAQALSMLPQYGRFTPNVADGMSTYHSAQFKAQKRFSDGLSFLLAYTLSKSLTDTNSQLLRQAYGSITARDSYNKGLDKTLASDDRTHVVSISFLYELPFGPGKRFLKEKGISQYIFGGWQVNGVLSYASGYPLAIGGNFNLLPDGGVGANRIVTPDAVSGPARGLAQSGKWQPGVSVYANISAWSQVSGYRIGTSPYILPDLRGFASKNENLAVFKSFDFNERVKFQIKAEALDVLNRFIPSDPNMGWNPVNVQWGKTYGQANTPRILQFGAKLTF